MLLLLTSMEEITKTYFIEAPIEKVWEALTDNSELEAWGADPADMSEDEEYEFSLWGGDIHGKNIEIVKPSKIVQEWFGGNWPKPSTLTIELEKKDHGTEVSLLHENVPEEDMDKVDEGWDDSFFGPLKEYLEEED